MLKNKSNKSNKSKYWDWFFKTLTIILTVWMIITQIQINSLGKSQLADDIIISSPQIDHKPIKIDQSINVSLDITNNYDGAILTTVKLDEVKLNGEKESSFIKHTWVTPQEQKIKGDSETSFISTFEAGKKGEYDLIFIIFYNYPQGEDPTKGKTRFYTLSLSYIY